MDIIKDLVLVNKESFSRTVKSLKNGWPLFFVGFVYIILNTALFTILSMLFIGPLSFFIGFIALIISSGFISNYLYLLFNLINYNRITLQNFKDGFGYFLRKIYGIYFIGWVLSVLLSFVTGVLGQGAIDINIIISASILIFLNALPETAYIKSYDSMGSITYSLDFMKENWFNWLIPNLVFMVIIYYLTGQIFGGLFKTHMSYGIFRNGSIYIRGLLGQIVFTIGMIYRGHLYKILSSGNRRKRIFMNTF